MKQQGVSPRMSTRAVGVATLARQHLIDRVPMPAVEMISHLVGMQAQAPFPPYFGLWSRIVEFRAAELSWLLENARVVRLVLMRGTVHLVTAEDAAFLRPLIQPILDRDLLQNPLHGRALKGIAPDAVAAEVRKILADAPLGSEELGPRLAERFGGVPAASLVHAARNTVPLVQAPPRAVWGQSGKVRLVPLEQWVNRAPQRHPSIETMMLRYLAAFGPATVADAQAWSGLTRLGEVMDRLRPQLVTFTAESGAELFDLPDAPRPDADTRLPVRILAAFDNLLLSHADRSRVISADSRSKLFTPNGIFPPVVLLQGQVVGQVKHAAAAGTSTVTVTPYRKLSKAHTASIAAEARRYSRFAAAADVHDVVFTEVV